jgi:predicted dehydrogenase
MAAVADPDVERAARLAAGTGAPAYADHLAMIADAALDAAIVASPNWAHHRQVIDLLEAGVPTLVEKPMALDPVGCREMAAMSRERAVPLVIGHVQRYLPPVAAAMRLIAQGAIGDLRLIVDQYSSRYEPGTRPDWFLDPRLAPNGILANLGCHSLDRCLLFSRSTVVDVRAAWLRGETVPTEVSASLGLANGIAATVILTGTGLPTGESIQLIGTSGAIRLQTGRGLELYRRGEVVHRELPGETDEADAFIAQLMAFARTIAGDPPEVGSGYGIAVIDAIEAIAEVALAR